MNEEKKKVGKLDQKTLEDVKGGIPYEDPGLIILDEPGEEPPPEEPGAPIGDQSCKDGFSNLGSGGCTNGYTNLGAGGCGHGDGVLQP